VRGADQGEVRDIFVFTHRIEEDAKLTALRTCGAERGPGCITVTTRCDRVRSTTPPETGVVEQKRFSRNEQSVPPLDAKPAEPTTPPTGPEATGAIHTSSDFSLLLSTLQDYLRSAVEDVQSSIDIEDIKTVALIAATLAVASLVVIQIISLIRTGQRRTRDLVFQAIIGLVFVGVGTLAWFIIVYTTTKLSAFGGTLSSAGKVLLGSSAIGGVLLALPYSFWRMLGNISVYRLRPWRALADQGPQHAPSSDTIGEYISGPAKITATIFSDAGGWCSSIRDGTCGRGCRGLPFRRR
jgi:hypothetical protein